MSCVPRMSLSLTTSSYSYWSFCFSYSIYLMMASSLFFSTKKFLIFSSFSAISFLNFSIFFYSSSIFLSFLLCSVCSLTNSASLASIYSFNWVIWWVTRLYLLLYYSFCSWTSASFFETKFLSDLTASYKDCCFFNFASVSIFCFWNSAIKLSLSLTSSLE